jgi:hypothetical protein
MLITNRNYDKRTASSIGDWYKKHCKNELSYMTYTLASEQMTFLD